MTPTAPNKTAIVLIDCPDRKGIVAVVSDFLFRHNANILHADQHQDADLGLFLTRIEWDLSGFDLDAKGFARKFAPIARRFEMHCEIPLVISNHSDAQRLAEFHRVPFHHIPTGSVSKQKVEEKQVALLREHSIGLVVLARYMQILSPQFVRRYPQRIINVHHSFLPAFSGARPYHRAFERGVKLIGATSHYVTEKLDEGPIIEQDVVRISHRDQLQDLIQKGRDIEKAVLSRAVRWHIEHRILVYAKKTVVFD